MRTKRLSKNDLGKFLIDLGEFIAVGTPVLKALKILQKMSSTSSISTICESVHDSIEKGDPLDQAFSNTPQVFDIKIVKEIQSAQKTGNLAQTLIRIGTEIQTAYALKRSVQAMLVYPCVILLFAMGLGVATVTLILPQYEQMFSLLSASGAQLPGLTQALMDFSGVAPTLFIGLIILLPIMFFAHKQLYDKNENYSLGWDRFKLKLPLIGSHVLLSQMQSFCQGLSSILNSGIGMLEALPLLELNMKNRFLGQKVLSLKNPLIQGQSLHQALALTQTFPDWFHQIIAVGEETGNLPQALANTQKQLANQIQQRLKTKLSLIEPAIIVVLAIVVGTLVLALFLPILQLMDNLTL